MPAIELYRSGFKPSPRLERPHLMVGANVIAADTDEEARLLATSLQQAFVGLRRGRPGRLPAPVEHFEEQLLPEEQLVLDEMLACSFVGAPETVRRELAAFLGRTGADEVIVAAHVHDHQARLRSFALTAEVARGFGGP
jgi:alkanesulfonate monooxygenase SsuD/methylene tetrahydromethanopterin reductase-like flavin-dependent oxidoreductase (luciferase family)